ncbi:tRNA 2-thiouridine(34) synthase MnmA [Mycoplasmoides alvi]|uniref:tRNA 2-thiouridine(34) synthase MnmA n=1 Tax=Mycoplasmoides alvi TaxID=78580 RepID=UPI0006990345|nr:tRNA 2-thiouridine(34) synthase MnmA [Mycoplasmoides alvi]
MNVIVGLSGGVDSAVSALLLKEKGHHVIGIYMVNWDKEINGDFFGSKQSEIEFGCNSEKDFKDAKKIAEQLGIKLLKINFVKEYWDLVFKTVLNEYKNNLTPNPDILCNKFIKFGILKDYIDKNYPGFCLATGHYAKLLKKQKEIFLTISKDENKDQTYFLCHLNQKQLSNVIFPLENYLKTEVRDIAKKNNLIVADKKDSTGICFIGERHFKHFLENYFNKETGEIKLLPELKVIGKHDGIKFYTIGQRHGLNLGGMKEKVFVVKKDSKTNTLYVALESELSKYLETNYTTITTFNWINDQNKIDWKNENFFVRFRHRQKLIPCFIKKIWNDNLEIYYPYKTLAVTPGQYAAIYTSNKICIGGGKILESKLI